jgi:hypothetical protein
LLRHVHLTFRDDSIDQRDNVPPAQPSTGTSRASCWFGQFVVGLMTDNRIPYEPSLRSQVSRYDSRKDT